MVPFRPTPRHQICPIRGLEYKRSLSSRPGQSTPATLSKAFSRETFYEMRARNAIKTLKILRNLQKICFSLHMKRHLSTPPDWLQLAVQVTWSGTRGASVVFILFMLF